MSNIPAELKFTKDHEWVRVEGDTATIGISDHAQEQLGDIVFVELPEVGEALKQGDSFGVVESVKSVSDVFSPISGEVIEINEALNENPEAVNEDCYGEGWIAKVKITNKSEIAKLMDATDYENFTKEESE